jgi:hypothetical protein
MAESIRKTAMEIVVAEEAANGWQPRVLGSWKNESAEGCDILSTPPDGGEAHPVEVKGWGDPLLGARGGFTWTQEIQPSQMEAARRNQNFRLEIVANLRAYHAGLGDPERLTVSADYIRQHAFVSQYRIPLDALKPVIQGVDASIVRRHQQGGSLAQSGASG